MNTCPITPRSPMTTLILSDLHLGSRNCQARCIGRALDAEFDCLILNCDTVNSLNLKKLQPEHWLILAQLREVARQRELILIRGNHDGGLSAADEFGPCDVLAAMLGVKLREEYMLDVGGR